MSRNAFFLKTSINHPYVNPIFVPKGGYPYMTPPHFCVPKIVHYREHFVNIVYNLLKLTAEIESFYWIIESFQI